MKWYYGKFSFISSLIGCDFQTGHDFPFSILVSNRKGSGSFFLFLLPQSNLRLQKMSELLSVAYSPNLGGWLASQGDQKKVSQGGFLIVKFNILGLHRAGGKNLANIL